jgi:O-antigen biosynthesis protein
MDYSGSDIFTAVLVDFLKRKGHNITVYSKYLGKIALGLASEGVRIIGDLSEISNEIFDIAHVHHNINAIEIRYYFPNIPILFLSHGVLPLLEKPPRINVNIAAFVAVSEEIRDQLVVSGVDPHKIKIFRNIIDSQKFRQFETIRQKPAKALILSNKIDKVQEEIIKAACDDLDISCKFAGQNYGIIEQDYLPYEINDVDIVFSLGRGIMEAMLCGRIPIVYDYRGGDGMVTPDNFHELKKYNFSGRRYKKQFNVQELKNEIKRYEPASAIELRSLVLDEYDAHHRIDDLINIYSGIVENRSDIGSLSVDLDLIEYFVRSLQETRQFKDAITNKVISQAKDEYIEDLYSGRGWRLLLKYYRLRDGFFPEGNKMRTTMGQLKKILRHCTWKHHD